MFKITVEKYDFKGGLENTYTFEINEMPNSVHSLVYVVESKFFKLYQSNYLLEIKEIESGNITKKLILNNI